MKRETFVWELVFAALAIAAAVPVWVVPHPPIQDLPQHLAAIRVLHDHGNADFGFSQYFELHLGRTQYLTYYVLTHCLAYPFGIFVANKLVITAAIVGLPYSVRALLLALGRDFRVALFALPLAWNAHLMLGFVNFVAAIPITFAALAVAVGLRLRWDVNRALWLAGLAVFTFYTHVVPFGFLVLGVVLVSAGRDLRAMALRLTPLIPALLAVGGWLRTSPAAKTLLGMGAAEGEARPEYHPFRRSVAELGTWLFDVLRSRVDETLLAVWVILFVAALWSSERVVEREAPEKSAGPSTRDLALRLALLGPLALVCYFVLPASYAWVWPINARFPIIGSLFILLAVEQPRRKFALPIYAAVCVLSLVLFREVGVAFVRAHREEGRELYAAIESLPKGRRVVGLVWERDSRFVRGSPYLHAAAMYQAARGGAVMFSFAEYPQSPFTFKADNRPPEVPPRWEWFPMMVRPVPDLDWFEYVITGGDPGALPLYPDGFELARDGERWKVWKRRDPSLPFENGPAVLRLLSDAPGIEPAPGSSCAMLTEGRAGQSLSVGIDLFGRAGVPPTGRCSGLGAEGRTCELALVGRADGADQKRLRVQFVWKDRAVSAQSLRCELGAAQPPM
ncbi:MAG: hypothetical protein IPI67_20560 [Myxococcales bacterium]|nr:hypothetical protein [Myxococcales bacterium]